MSFGSQLKKARKNAGLTQKQLASAIDAKHNSISNWENDQNRPDPDTIAALCGVLHISPNFLLGEAPIPPGYQPMPEMVSVPLVGRIACGDPITAEENIEGHTSIPAQWHASFTLMCEGASMEPSIHDGDLVAIRIQPTVENGQIAAVRIENEATLKRVYLYEDHIELRPENPAYPSIIRFGENMNDVHIEGKAVGLCRGL